MFEPVARTSVVDACVEALRSAIVAGELPVGERLPPERDLAVRFGVNRTTLRMALRQVAAGGLLAVRQGSGHTVLDFRSTGGPDLVPALLAAARSQGRLVQACAELLAIRRSLARGLLERLAAHPPSEPATAAVGAAIDRLDRAIVGGASPSEVAALDLSVVSAFVAASDSTMLGLFVNPVAHLLAGLPALAEAMYADPAANLAAWRALAAVVGSGDLEVDPLMALLAARDAATLQRLEATCSGS